MTKSINKGVCSGLITACISVPIQCQLDLFDKIIKPILLYGCEVWGFSKNEIIERVHLRFCKLLLNFKTPTPSYMVYGE